MTSTDTRISLYIVINILVNDIIVVPQKIPPDNTVWEYTLSYIFNVQ